MSERVLYILKVSAFAFIYFVTAKIGLELYTVNTFAAFIWMPTGIALGVLILHGKKLWPGIAIGAFFINIFFGASLPVALGIASGNTLEALCSIYILERYFKFNPLFERLKDSLGFLVTVLLTSTISATIGVMSLTIGGVLTTHDWLSTWNAWWLGDTLGAFTIAPFIIRWFSQPIFWRNKTRKEIIEGAMIFILLISTCFFVFWTHYAQLGFLPIIYLIFLPLMWATVRTGLHGVTLSIALISLIGISSAVLQQGSFNELTQMKTLGGIIETQIFIGFLTFIFLPFVSIVAEQRNTTRILKTTIHDLREVLRKLNSEDRAKNEFLAVLAHELRNPLAPLMSSLELMKMKVSELERTDLIHLVNVSDTHIRTMTRLLDDLLDISRISQKKFKLQKETISLQRIAEHSKETVSPFYASKEQNLTLSVPQKPILVYVDPIRIEQVFNNILYNAAKYTQNGGNVKLSITRSNKKEVCISIQDNGMGIDPNNFSKIFEQFAQLTPHGHIGTGLGIGLWLTKRLVELHGGIISVKSEGIGKGSEFIIKLPVNEHTQLSMELPPGERRSRQRAPTIFSHGKTGGNDTILVVDDNKDAADSLRVLLERKGYKAYVAYNGADVVTAAREHAPSIIILDIGLPDMDGYRVAKILRKEFGNTHMLIALTGYGREKDKLEAQKAGFDYHLTKPVSINDIEHILKVTRTPEKTPTRVSKDR